MKIYCSKVVILSFVLTCPFLNIYGQKDDPVIFWKFDRIEQNEKVTSSIYREHEAPDRERITLTEDEISGRQGRIFGNFFKLVPGISGNALMLDGLTSFINAEANSLP